MKRIDGLTEKDSETLYRLLLSDANFTYDASEGAFITEDKVCVGVDKSPYQCCLYALSDIGKRNLEKWHSYVLSKWKHNQSDFYEIEDVNAEKILERIVNVVKNEQNSSSTEYTKSKSFEMIETIIDGYLIKT